MQFLQNQNLTRVQVYLSDYPSFNNSFAASNISSLMSLMSSRLLR